MGKVGGALNLPGLSTLFGSQEECNTPLLMLVWNHCIYFLLSLSDHSPFPIFQSSVVDIHVGHPLFYDVLILIPFLFL